MKGQAAVRLPVAKVATSRLHRLRAALDSVRASCDPVARMRLDPVSFAHGFSSAKDQELAGLVASCCAFGNATTINAKLSQVRERLGSNLVDAGQDRARLVGAMHGFRHRLYQGEDLAFLLHGACIVQREHGTLGRAFAKHLASAPGLQQGLATFADEIRMACEFPSSGARRGPAHLLPDVLAGSASKRLLLYLRWMVRPADGVDLGLWPVSPAVLLMPVDVHVHKLALNLGFTTASTPSWRMAEEITAVLRNFDAADPVKYDFALCHLGMAGGCESKFLLDICGPCAMRDVCRHG